MNRMIGSAKIGVILGVIGCTLAACAIGAGLFVESGVYDIGADDHHTQIVLGVIEQLRERSIGVRDRSIELRYVEDPERIAAGAQHYAALCAGCHLAPGVTKSEIRPGLYPHPPNLAQEDLRDGRRAFWIIKHGIKMSAMPAWGKTLDDAAIWDLVSFVRKMPDMTPETYRQISRQ
jgi:cytochrome c553